MPRSTVDSVRPSQYQQANFERASGAFLIDGPVLRPIGRRDGSTHQGTADTTMKIKNSLKALKARHRENRLVRRKGRVYVINKQNPRFKARQG